MKILLDSKRETSDGHTHVKAHYEISPYGRRGPETCGLVSFEGQSGMSEFRCRLTPDEARGLATDLLVAAEETEAAIERERVEASAHFSNTGGLWYWRDAKCEEPMGPFPSEREARADHSALRG